LSYFQTQRLLAVSSGNVWLALDKDKIGWMLVLNELIGCCRYREMTRLAEDRGIWNIAVRHVEYQQNALKKMLMIHNHNLQ